MKYATAVAAFICLISSQTNAEDVSMGPCTQIEKACHRAGFASGFGLEPDCIRPIMTATPQQQQATKPLPQVDPQVVAACKQQDPNFGKDD